MPPANRQLQWTKIEKFGGMWTAGDKLLMPPDGAQLMSGCHPQPQGGLRAFYKAVPDISVGSAGASMLDDPPSPLSGGTVLPTGIVPLAVYHVGDLWHCIFGWAMDDGDTGFTGSVPQRPEYDLLGPWQLRTEGGDTPLMVDALPSPGNPSLPNNILPKVVLLRPTSSAISVLPTAFMVIVGNPDDGGNSGLWRMVDGSTYDSVLADVTIRAVDIHQSRVVIALLHSIVFSSPGTFDITAAYTNYINLGGGNVVWMLPLAPADLLVGTTTGAIFNIQGDLSDPVVRTLVNPSSGVGYHHVPASTRYGPVAITSIGPTIIGTDGAFQPLAESIDRSIWQHNGGSLSYSEDVLYAPNWHVLTVGEVDELKEIRRNGAMAYDFRTQAWFTTSHPDDVDCPNPVCITLDPVDVFSTVLYAGNYYEAYEAARPNVYVTPTKLVPIGSPPETTLSFYYDTAGDRASVYEWMSAPLHTPDGREVDLQEVQIGAMGFHAAEGSTLTITATNEFNETVTSNLDVRAGRGVYTLPLRIRGQYVDIRIKAVALDGSEAPMLEFVNFGWVPGHLPQDSQTGGYPTAYPGGY